MDKMNEGGGETEKKDKRKDEEEKRQKKVISYLNDKEIVHRDKERGEKRTAFKVNWS